jgi:hypothetical protein
MRKHPKTLLKVYRLFLIGLPGEEILTAEISASDIQKIKEFHKSLQEGKSFYIAGMAVGIEKHIAKRMLHMFEQWQSGLPLLCVHPLRNEYPRINFCFSLLLDGFSDSELEEKCTEYEIGTAKNFMKYVEADMLSSTIASETGLLRSTVKSLLKIYRDKLALASLPSGGQHSESMLFHKMMAEVICQMKIISLEC